MQSRSYQEQTKKGEYVKGAWGESLVKRALVNGI